MRFVRPPLKRSKLSTVLSSIGELSWTVRNFHLSHSPLADGRSEADGNESTAIVSCALGMFLVDWPGSMVIMSESDWVMESIQEIVSEMNKAKRRLYPIPSIHIDARNTECGL